MMLNAPHTSCANYSPMGVTYPITRFVARQCYNAQSTQSLVRVRKRSWKRKRRRKPRTRAGLRLQFAAHNKEYVDRRAGLCATWTAARLPGRSTCPEARAGRLCAVFVLVAVVIGGVFLYNVPRHGAERAPRAKQASVAGEPRPRRVLRPAAACRAHGGRRRHHQADVRRRRLHHLRQDERRRRTRTAAWTSSSCPPT